MNKKIGSAVLIFWKGSIGLLLRDKNPSIAWPNTWAPCGGGQEEGETLLQTATREVEEEISITPNILPLGLTPWGNGIFYSQIGEKEKGRIRLRGEGQKFEFFFWHQLRDIELGGVFRDMFYKHQKETEKMVREGKVPNPKKLGLIPFN